MTEFVAVVLLMLIAPALLVYFCLKRPSGYQRHFLFGKVMIQADADSVAAVEAEFLAERKKCGKARPTDCLWIDFGGAIFIMEPQVEFEANGVRLGTFARQLPTLLGALSEAPEEIPGHFVLGGFIRRSVISAATRDAALKVLPDIVRQNQKSIDLWERRMAGVASESCWIRKARCVYCGSNKPYIKCCGSPAVVN